MPLTSSTRFRQIDDLTIEYHTLLNSEDNCFFLYERTSGRGYSYSCANQLVANIKKHPVNSSPAELIHKRKAIRQCSDALRKVLKPECLKQAVLVPVPPSKKMGDPAYDDRMEKICQGIGPNTDVRKIVIQGESMVPSHERGGDRISVADLLGAYTIDEKLVSPAKRYIFVVDDVLTVGTHYRAMHTILSERFSDAEISGIFIARRVFPDN